MSMEDLKHDGPGTVELGVTNTAEAPEDVWDEDDDHATECERWHAMYERVPEGSPMAVSATAGGRKIWAMRAQKLHGNTKRGKLWMGVVFEPRVGQKEQLDEFLEQHTDKFAYQLERGANGRLHYQLAFRMKGKTLWPWKRLYGELLQYGLWNCRVILNDTNKFGRRDLFTYCIKSESRVQGPWHKGLSNDQQGKRNDIVAFKDAIKAGAIDSTLVDDHTTSWFRYYRAVEPTRAAFCPTDTPTKRVEFRYGGSGAGKTTSVLTDYPPDSVFKLAKPNTKNGSLWFNGYKPHIHKVVLIDEFAPAWIPITTLMGLLDSLPQEVQIKGGYVKFRPEVVIITANMRWQELYKKHFTDIPQHIMALHRRLTEIRHYTRVRGWKTGDPPSFTVPKDEQYADQLYTEEGLPVASGAAIAPYQPKEYFGGQEGTDPIDYD